MVVLGKIKSEISISSTTSFLMSNSGNTIPDELPAKENNERSRLLIVPITEIFSCSSDIDCFASPKIMKPSGDS